MKLPILGHKDGLCGQCVALCCRYYAMEIDKPTTRREFEDVRWFLLHEDTVIFVEDGAWYVQVNRKCRHLLPDNRCGIYDNRPPICREYKTEGCDWHADEEYEYEHVFSDGEQLQRFMNEYLAKKRRDQAAKRRKAAAKTSKRPTPRVRRGTARKPRNPVSLRKSA